MHKLICWHFCNCVNKDPSYSLYWSLIRDTICEYFIHAMDCHLTTWIVFPGVTKVFFIVWFYVSKHLLLFKHFICSYDNFNVLSPLPSLTFFLNPLKCFFQQCLPLLLCFILVCIPLSLTGVFLPQHRWRIISLSNVNFPEATWLKKITLPHPTAINCQHSHREDWGLMDPSSICENMLTSLVVYTSCANNFSYSVFMCTVAMSCSKEVALMYIFPCLWFLHFPNFFSTVFPAPGRDDTIKLQGLLDQIYRISLGSSCEVSLKLN